MDIGMRLGGEQIRQITGPSTYCILVPPQDSSLPIQLLFGDVHRSFNNPCEDEKHAYKIYDEFITVLDKVGKIYPVNFYTESAYGKFIDRVRKIDNGYLFSRVVRRMQDCYDEKERSSYSYEEKCPSTYIQWHHVDARFFENSVEGYVFSYLRNFLLQQLELPIPLTGWIKSFEDEKIFTNDTTTSTSGYALSLFIIQLIVNYVETCPKLLDEDEVPYHSENKIRLRLLSSRLKNPKYIKKQRELRNEVLDILRQESGVYQHYRRLLYEILNVYFHSINRYNSSTAKQLNKLQARRGSNVSDLKERLTRVAADDLEKLKPILHMLFSIDIKSLENIQRLLQMPDRNGNYGNIQIEGDFQRDCKVLLLFLDQIFCYLLDIFYIVRMLQTKDSYLSVGYFGDSHTQHIKNYLINHLGYQVLVESEQLDRAKTAEEVSRCITLENIDLDQLLDQQLTTVRKKHIVLRIKQLNKEQQERNEKLRKDRPLWPVIYNLKEALPIPREVIPIGLESE